MARTKIKSGQAEVVAAGVVPDPNAVAAPPPENAIESGADPAPWDDEGETIPIEELADAPGTSTRSKGAVAAEAMGAGRGWGGVVEHALTIADPEELYRRLYEDLRLGDAATEYGAVLAACDRAEQNAVDAVRLMRHAKLEDESVTRRVSERVEVLRTAAKRELDKEVADSYDEKLKKATKKAPTIQDIEDRIIANWTDEYSTLQRRKSEMHAVLRVTEGLVESWRSRCATLRMILDRVAGGRPR